MVGYDCGNDRETEAGAALSAGIVRLEDAGAQARVDAGAVVGDFESHERGVGKAGTADLDLRAGAIVIDGRDGSDGVVEQLDERAFHRVAIYRDERNRGIEREHKLDVGMSLAKICDGLASGGVEV